MYSICNVFTKSSIFYGSHKLFCCFNRQSIASSKVIINLGPIIICFQNLFKKKKNAELFVDFSILSTMHYSIIMILKRKFTKSCRMSASSIQIKRIIIFIIVVIFNWCAFSVCRCRNNRSKMNYLDEEIMYVCMWLCMFMKWSQLFANNFDNELKIWQGKHISK